MGKKGGGGAAAPRVNGAGAAAKERRIAASQAWEIRFRHVEQENARLRQAVLTLQEQNLVLQRQMLQADIARQQSERKELFQRLQIRGGEELVERDGDFVIRAVPEEKAPPDGPPSGRMEPGGAPSGGGDDAGGK